MYLRDLEEKDYPLIMAWRSNPLVYSGFYSQKGPLEWKGHVKYHTTRNSDWRTFIIEVTEDDVTRPVGVLNIGQLDNWKPELGVWIGEVALWGRGIGMVALRYAIDWIKLRQYPYQVIGATILDNNERSIRLFKSMGFVRICKAREGESEYEYRL